MGSLGFTLADRLGAKSLPCSVPGCTRTWLSLAGAGKGLKLGGRSAPDPNDPASGMCDPCRDKFATLRDQDHACARPGCDGTWTWPVAAQLAAFATKEAPPVRLCSGCEQRLAALEDKPIPCSVAGCTRSSVFTRKAQLLAGAPEVEAVAPPTMCAPCDGVFKKLKNRQVSCGINGCKHKWMWTTEEQISAYATGKPNEPPRRMCDECKTVFGTVADREVRCRTSGCKKTWTWSRGDQLDACLAGKPVPKAPARMCPSCLDIYSKLKDVERPCRRTTCKRTWTDKRGAQLARAVRGKTGDPYPHYCPECEKELGELEDRQVPCKTDHCTGTWTWTSAQQLAAGVRPVVKAKDAGPEGAVEAGPGEGEGSATTFSHASGSENASPNGDSNGHLGNQTAPAEGAMAAATGDPAARGALPKMRKNRNRNRKRRHEPRPPEKRCEACIEFLKDRKTHEIPCSNCHTPIYWPPESQLQTHLGNWAEPSLCGACKRDATEAARAAQREALRHPPMPGTPQVEVGATPPAEVPPQEPSPEPTSPPT
ncbi:MAG TPA: hypothetical protein VFH68_00885 [Polyangia bacterium]|jgi:hypothetical protein|nr:hypothetical protein [Polyangia bacterium]